MLATLERGVKGGVWYSLIDKVYPQTTLEAAWQKVRANKGAAGSDHQSITAFESNCATNLARLGEEIRTDTYRPRPIRRTYIDKTGSKEKRPLGIPTVRDRVTQTAVCMVIEPILEREFAPHSYGFRPNLGCKDALREAVRLLKAGYTHVVDADIKAYFDSIPHEPLMEEVRKYIADGRVLGLIEAYLKQDILEELKLWTPETGTPQGAVLSPLLANLYLHPVDVAMAEAGHQMIRYADDFVILCRNQEEATAALEAVRTLLTERGLTLHPDKTRLVDTTTPEGGFDFLGYRFEQGTRFPRKKSMKKFKDAIREKTKRANGKSLPEIIKSVNYTMRGWFEYFKHSRKWTFQPLDGWIRRRLRSILRKRSKRQGISLGYDHIRWPNKFFQAQGLFNLEAAYAAECQSLAR
jgi:RNA-directed DNA polymerase